MLQLQTSLFRTQTPVINNLSKSRPLLTFIFTFRKYATHRDQPPPSSLSRSLDQTPGSHRNNDFVGPFQLGLAQSSLKPGEKVKKWSELSAGGKVMRTTERTTNLTVILLGAGLSALLIYALTTELFSKNSPTVLYNDTCETIKASPEVAKYLLGPLSFHNNPPSAIRPRHRNRHVSSQVFLDSTGREHMRLHFYVQGHPPGSPSPPSESSYFVSLAEWTQNKASILSELTLDESIAWAKDCAAEVRERSKRLFRYLSGKPLPPAPLHAQPSPDPINVSKENEEGVWSFAGLFSGLRRLKGPRPTSNWEPEGQVWTEGEIHADFIMNNDGYFISRSLYLDMPDSRSPNRKRVVIGRGGAK